MITIRRLVKQFGKLTVLRELDLEIERGKITAIIGHNGSGKTTLIKCILGLDKPTSGSITINNFELNGDCTYRSRIGYMPQLARFPENLTAREVFRMIRDLRGREERLEDDLVAFFNLDGELEKPVRTLSGGTRQKISAIITFMFDPELLILDEPTAGLDPISSSMLKDRLFQEKAAGKTIIITSHIMSELEELADNLVFLLDGKIIYSGTVEDLIEQSGEKNLERAVAALMTRNGA